MSCISKRVGKTSFPGTCILCKPSITIGHVCVHVFQRCLFVCSSSVRKRNMSYTGCRVVESPTNSMWRPAMHCLTLSRLNSKQAQHDGSYSHSTFFAPNFFGFAAHCLDESGSFVSPFQCPHGSLDVSQLQGVFAFLFDRIPLGKTLLYWGARRHPKECMGHSRLHNMTSPLRTALVPFPGAGHGVKERTKHRAGHGQLPTEKRDRTLNQYTRPSSFVVVPGVPNTTRRCAFAGMWRSTILLVQDDGPSFRPLDIGLVSESPYHLNSNISRRRFFRRARALMLSVSACTHSTLCNKHARSAGIHNSIQSPPR